MTDRLYFDFSLMAIQAKFGVPDGWEVYAWERKNHGTPSEYIEYRGACVSATYKSGPRKGAKNWAPKNRTHEMSIPMTRADIDGFLANWSEETGLCHHCHGNGTAWFGWSSEKGNRYKHCDACNGTGKYPLYAEAAQ